MQVYQTEVPPCSATTREEMGSQQLSSASIGRLSELVFERIMLESGYSVARPQDPGSCPYDFIVDNGTLIKVQVKTLRPRKNGKLELKLRSTHRNSGDHSYDEQDADYIVGVDLETELLYWVSTSEIQGRTSVTF
jgi:hypothetical protein